MALRGFFGRKSADAVIKKHGPRAANKRAQPHDRWESIQALLADASPEAVSALMQRFTVRVDPSITDQEEKEGAFKGLVGLGDVVVEPVRAFMADAESLAWPLKILGAVLSEQDVIAELLGLLSQMDTEYERDPQRKFQVLLELSDRKDPRIVAAATPFVDDVNETARFHAVGTVLSQDNREDAKDAFLKAIPNEESVRVKSRILDAFIENDWPVAEGIEALRPKLPAGYSITNKGVVQKK